MGVAGDFFDGLGFDEDDTMFDDIFDTPPNTTLIDTTSGRQSATSWPLLALAVGIYGVVGVVALLGNVLFCVVIWQSQKLHQVTHMLMTNLGVANLIFIAFHPPFFVTKFVLQHNWVLGGVMCKVCFTTNYLTATASFYFMALVAIDRWLAIFCRRHRLTKRRALYLSIFVWFSAFLTSSPYLLIVKVVDRGAIWAMISEGPQESTVLRYECRLQCDSEDVDCHGELTFFSVVAQFILPLLVMLPTYGHLACFLWQRPDVVGESTKEKLRRAQRHKRNTLGILLAIVASLIICWGPLHLTAVLFKLGYLPYAYARPIQIVSGIAAALSVSLTPVLYLINDSFRGELLRLLHFVRGPIDRYQHSHTATARAHQRGDVDSSVAPPLRTRHQNSTNATQVPTGSRHVRRQTVYDDRVVEEQTTATTSTPSHQMLLPARARSFVVCVDAERETAVFVKRSADEMMGVIVEASGGTPRLHSIDSNDAVDGENNQIQ